MYKEANTEGEQKPSDGECVCYDKQHMSNILNRIFAHSEENGSQTKTPPIVIADGASDSSSNDDSEEEESLGKVVTKMGKEIDRKSAGNIKRSKEEEKLDPETENEFGYTDSKSRHRY